MKKAEHEQSKKKNLFSFHVTMREFIDDYVLQAPLRYLFISKSSHQIILFLHLSSGLSVKQVFKDMEFLGWYTTGGPPDQSDIHIHKQVGRH